MASTEPSRSRFQFGVLQEARDLIYLPDSYSHEVENVGETVAISGLTLDVREGHRELKEGAPEQGQGAHDEGQGAHEEGSDGGEGGDKDGEQEL